MKTTEAARRLGISPQTLMRYRDDRGGFLAAGVDYFYGPHENSPINWNVEEVQKQLHRRGLGIRKAQRIIEAQRAELQAQGS